LKTDCIAAADTNLISAAYPLDVGARAKDAAAMTSERQAFVSMDILHAAAALGLLGDYDIRQKPSARRAGKEQCLGEMPWISRATAIKPDNRYLP
jgi:hypothetical protein